MVYLIRSAGIFSLPLIALTLVVAALVLRCVYRLYLRRPADPEGLEAAPQPILFWGAIGAVLGVLGQCSGTYHAARAIAGASAISPAVIAAGVAEALTTTLWGLTLLFVSAIAWFVLRGRARRLAAPRG